MKKGPKAGRHYLQLKPTSFASTTNLTGGAGFKRMFEFPDDRPLMLDLTFLKSFGVLGDALANGLFVIGADKRRVSIMNCRSALFAFSKYLCWLINRGEMPPQPLPNDLTSSLAAGFAQWLTESRISGYRYGHQGAYSMHRNAMSIVAAAQRSSFNQPFDTELKLASNPLGWTQSAEAQAHRVQPLILVEYRAVRAAAAKEALAILVDPLRRQFPTGIADLFPFWLLLLIDTSTNPSSVSQLTRNCIEGHQFDTNKSIIVFGKPRGGSGAREEYLFETYESKDPLAPVNVIRFLERWTAPLVERAAKHDRQKLFIYAYLPWKRSTDHLAIKDYNVTVLYDMKLMTKVRKRPSPIRAFCDRNNLVDFQPRRLRETSAYHDWLRHRSILRIKIKLNHSRSSTTVNYLRASGIVDVGYDEMSTAISAMTKRLGTRPTVRDKPLIESMQGDPRIGNEAAAKIAGGIWDTGMSGCLDPFDSPMPNQTKGTLCSAFWGCLYCKNAWFAREHLPLLLARKRTLIGLQDDMPISLWIPKYGNIVEALEEAISSYSAASIAEAEGAVTEAHRVAANLDVIALLKIPLTP